MVFHSLMFNWYSFMVLSCCTSLLRVPLVIGNVFIPFRKLFVADKKIKSLTDIHHLCAQCLMLIKLLHIFNRCGVCVY